MKCGLHLQGGLYLEVVFNKVLLYIDCLIFSKFSSLKTIGQIILYANIKHCCILMHGLSEVRLVSLYGHVRYSRNPY